MPTPTTDLVLLEDLEDVGRTSELAESDLDALHAVADWINTFVVRPHEDLGRAGPVFVPGALTIVVFTNLSADRAQGVFDDVLHQLAVPSYAEDGIGVGPFYKSPVPFLFVRQGVISDWNSSWTTRTGSTIG